MSSRRELLDANSELGAIMDKIIAIASEHPSIMITSSNKTDSLIFQESFGALTTVFSKRVDHFRREINKIADKLPRTRKKRTPSSDNVFIKEEDDA